MKKNFLLIGGYSGGNPGDEAILKSLVYRIVSYCPDAYFYILSDNKNFKLEFDRPVRFKIVYWNDPLQYVPNRIENRIMRKLYIVGFPFSRAVLAAIKKSTDLVSVIQSIDAIILVGGGYLTSLFSIENINYLIYVIQQFNKPIYLLGHTLGPFHKQKHVYMLEEILAAAKQVILRDESPELDLSKFSQSILKIADEAISFQPRLQEKSSQRSNASLTIGFNLRLWQDSRKFYPQIARVFLELSQSLKSHHLKILFIPMEDQIHADDRREAVEFQKYWSDSQSVQFEFVKEQLSVEEKYELIRSCDVFVGMRLHSLIFALSSGVPAIGLYHDDYYAQKVRGLFQHFAVESFALSFQDLHHLQDKMAELIHNRVTLKDKLLQCCHKIRNQQNEYLKAMVLEPCR